MTGRGWRSIVVRRALRLLLWSGIVLAAGELLIRCKYFFAHHRDPAYLVAGFAGRYTGPAPIYVDDEWVPRPPPFAVAAARSARDAAIGPFRTCASRTEQDSGTRAVRHLTYNTDCLRTPYGRDVPPGIVRIALVGDSTIEGGNVDDADTVPAVLEQILNERARVAGVRVRYQVLNAGSDGATARELIRLIDMALSGYRADLILFYEGFNDAKLHVFWADQEINRIGRSRRWWAIHRRLYYRSMAYTYAVEKYFLAAQRRRTAEVKADIRVRPDFEPSLRGAATIARESRVPLVMIKQVIGAPIVIDGVDTSNRDAVARLYAAVIRPGELQERLAVDTVQSISQRYAMARMEALARDAGVPVVDFLQAYDRDVPKRVFADLVHQSADGNRMLAQYIADGIEPFVPRATAR